MNSNCLIVKSRAFCRKLPSIRQKLIGIGALCNLNNDCLEGLKDHIINQTTT